MFDILTPKQMGEAEQASVKLGVSLGDLMDNAGEALGREVLLAAQEKMLRNIVILVGNGNNGGDGLVCANFLAESGVVPVVVLMCGKPKTDLSIAAFESLQKMIKVIDSDSVEYVHCVENAEIIVDCVFGTGFHGDIRANSLATFELAGRSGAYKIGCDVPSGVNALSGYVSNGTLKCDKTVTFHRAKSGMFISPAKEFCGEVVIKNIGIPSGWEQYIDFSIESPSLERIKSLLPKRIRNSHKGTYGKLILVCGCENYRGAAFISTRAALRSGVGIADLCTPNSVAASLVAAMPECIYTGMKCGDDGFITADNVPKILELSETASAMVVGCGLGVSGDTKELVYELIRKAACPIILDADGINCLSEHIDVLEEKRSEIILTPHPAELARLCGASVSDIVSDRIGYAVSLAAKYEVTIHAKGTQSITVTSDKNSRITDFGNTALAKGGSGDMLAGLIGSFVAQGLASHEACLLASALMGSTAEYLSEEKSERGILASDIINALPKVLKAWEK